MQIYTKIKKNKSKTVPSSGHFWVTQYLLADCYICYLWKNNMKQITNKFLSNIYNTLVW